MDTAAPSKEEGQASEDSPVVVAKAVKKKVDATTGEEVPQREQDIEDDWHDCQEKPLITLDELADKLGFGCFHVGLLFVVSAIWMADAMEMMLISFVTPQMQCYFELTDEEKALISSVVFVAMFFGAAFWGWFQDRFGRKIGYFASCAVVLVFGGATALADNYYLVLVCRFFVGFGVAGSHVAVTIFTEFLPANKRVLFIVLAECFWAVGSITEAALAWLIMPQFDYTMGWRVLIGVSTFPLVIVMFFWKVLPESPRFNLVKGRPERIEPVFRRAFRINGKEFPDEYRIDMRVNASDFDDHSLKGGSCKDLFRGQVMCKTTLMLWAIWVSLSFMYYGVVIFSTELFLLEDEGMHCPEYLNITDASDDVTINFNDDGDGDVITTTTATLEPTTFFNSSSNSTATCVELGDEDYRDAFIQSVAELPAMLWSYFMLEKWGRKPGIGVQMMVAGALFLVLIACTGREWETFFLFFVRGLATGAFLGGFVYTPEVYPTNIRATGLGFSNSASRIGGLATPYVAQVLTPISVPATIGLYAAMAVMAGVLAMMLPVETMGKDLVDSVEELELMASGGNNNNNNGGNNSAAINNPATAGVELSEVGMTDGGADDDDDDDDGIVREDAF